MRIEINSGGIDAAVAVSEYQLNASSFSKGIDSIISCFKAIKTETYNLSGGIGNLQGALDEINTRIAAEEERKNNADTIRKKTNDFLDLAIKVDNQVSSLVNQNRDEFYRLNPWLKPPVPESEKPWYEKAWNWLCETGEAIYEGVNNALTWIKDTAKKAWDGLVEFYEEHKKAIATVLMVIAAIAVIVLVPGGGLLATMAIGAAWGTIAGAAIGGISGGLQSKANGGSFWDGFEDGAFSGAIGGAVAGAAFAGLGFAGQALGKGISALSSLGKAVKVTSSITKTISIGMGAFDTFALADLVVDPNHNPIFDLNSRAHSSTAYNVAQTGISALAVFTGGMVSSLNKNPVKAQMGQQNGTEGYGDNINFGKDPLKKENYYSKGNNYDDFIDFWENPDDYELIRSNDRHVQTISARDIEGVNVSKSDLSNPSQFWNGSGRYGQEGYRDFVLNGKIQNTPVTVTKVVTNNKSFYYFGTDGRHRILTSQELGLDIPAIIDGTYFHK